MKQPLLAFLFVLCSSFSTQASLILDQSQTEIGGFNVVYGADQNGSGNFFAQSFTVGKSGMFVGIELWLSVESANPLTLSLVRLDQLLFPDTSAVLASKTLDFHESDVGTKGSFFFDLASANVFVDNAEQLAFTITTTSTWPNTPAAVYWESGPYDSYESGGTFYSWKPAPFYTCNTISETYWCRNNSSADMYFKTFVSAISVNEPATLGLFVLALATISRFRRS